MIGADGVNAGAGLVAAIGERDGERHLLEPSQEPLAVWKIIAGVDAVEDDRVDLAAVHLLYQAHHGRVVALTLERRAREIDGLPDVEKERVEGIHDDLEGDVAGS